MYSVPILLLVGLCLNSLILPGQNIEVILHYGQIITMEEQPLAEAMAISDGKIVLVGSEQEVMSNRQDETVVIDLKGKTVMPGFVDAHNHLFNDYGLDEKSLLEAQETMLQNGITTFGNLFADENVVQAIKTFATSGALKLKTSLYLAAVNNCGDVLGDWYKSYPPTRNFGEKLRIGGVKIFTDGGTCGTIPAVSFVYPKLGTMGDLFFDQQTLNEIIKDIDQAGYQLAVHAQGDRAIRQSIEALAQVTATTNPKRHRIEHNSFIPKDLLSAYQQYGIVPVAFGDYPTCEIEGLADAFGEENLFWLEDWRSLIDSNPNLPVAWHSDAPNLILDPIQHLFSYVTKEQVNGDGTRCTPPDWLLEHAISVQEALSLMTINAAYALDRDSEVGSLKEGKLADLVILAQNPLNIAPKDLIDIQILATMVEGEFVYCQEGSEQFCQPTTSIDSRGSQKDVALLLSPNPFSEELRFSFDISKASFVTLKILNINQETLASLLSEHLSPGHHEISWKPLQSSPHLAPGFYLYELQVGHHRRTGKIVYLP